MSKYKISKYSYDRANELNVNIKQSSNKNKKIDVFKRDGTFITSIGDSNYLDYPTYIIKNGIEYANNRRELYKKRHEKHRKIKKSRSYYADQILW